MALFSSWGKNGVTMIRDPVCGKQMHATETRYSTLRMGRTLFFCSPGCKFSFKRQGGIEAQNSYDAKKRLEEKAKRAAIRSSRCDSCH